MKTLSATIIGVKGGTIKNQNMGFIAVYSGNEKIVSVDNYKGSGDTYKQRNEPIICIFEGENCIFEGTHKQLIERLKTTK